MRAGISLLVWGVSLCSLLAQDCAPASRILPSGTVSASLDNSNCSLSDGTPYASYRLDLPVRGRIQIDLAAAGSLVLILRDAAGARIDSGTGVHRQIESGSYTLLVNARTPGQSAAYSIKTAFTPEPGMLCSSFPNIGLDQTVIGSLPAAGCTAPDGALYEAYTLTSLGAGYLNVTVASSDFTPSVLVRGSDGRALSPTDNTVGPNSVNVPLSADSQFVVVVSTADQTGAKTGAYQLTTAFTSADAETCRAARSFTDSDNDRAAISTSSCFVTVDGSADQKYYTYYTLSLAKPGSVELSAVSAEFTATLKVLDAGGNVLATDSGGGGQDQTLTTTSSLRLQLTPGNYAIQVFSDVPSGGSYSLKYLFTPGAPQPCAVSALNPGDAPAGQISSATCRTGLGWADLYTLTLAAAGTLNLDLASPEFDAVLAIRDAKDNLVVQNAQPDGATVAHITADLPAGAYTIVAAADQGSGAYRLNSKFAAHDIPACAGPQSLDINGGYIQRLGAGSCRAENGQPVDYYRFTLAADSLVAAVMTSSEVDGNLTLLDSAGKVLRTDYNSYGSNDPLIVQYLPAGDYKLAARDASGAAGGLYEVDLRSVPGPRPPFCAPKATVQLGSTATGAVTFSGCQFIDAFADIYQVDLTSDTTVDLRLNSSDFDAFLMLLDGMGNVVDQDDDSGGNTNARLITPLAAGSYYVVVKPSGGYTAHGNYSLALAPAN